MLVEAARYANSLDAGLAKSLLDHAGISAVLFDSGLNGVEPIGLLFPVRVMVLDEDLAVAREALADLPGV